MNVAPEGVLVLPALATLALLLVAARIERRRDHLSPFHHVGLVPAQPFQAGGAVALLAIGALAGLVGARCFERRDLAGA